MAFPGAFAFGFRAFKPSTVPKSERFGKIRISAERKKGKDRLLIASKKPQKGHDPIGDFTWSGTSL